MKNLFTDIKLVVFDVDGTLYAQQPVRIRMLFTLLSYYILHPLKIKELLVLQRFRKYREQDLRIDELNNTISQNQYLIFKNNSVTDINLTKSVVNAWIRNKPLPYLYNARYNNASHFIDTLNKEGIRTVVYSDYSAADKIEALKMNVNGVYSSEQSEVDVLKPKPDGLFYIAKQYNVECAEMLFVGDRPELDGVCAKTAGARYYNIEAKEANLQYQKLIHEFKKR